MLYFENTLFIRAKEGWSIKHFLTNNRETKMERRGWPFLGDCRFYVKKKWKYEKLLLLLLLLLFLFSEGEGVNFLKRRPWIVYRFKRGLGKRRDYVFEGGIETPIHTMSWRSLLIETNIQSKWQSNTVLLLVILTIIDT